MQRKWDPCRLMWITNQPHKTPNLPHNFHITPYITHNKAKSRSTIVKMAFSLVIVYKAVSHASNFSPMINLQSNFCKIVILPFNNWIAFSSSFWSVSTFTTLIWHLILFKNTFQNIGIFSLKRLFFYPFLVSIQQTWKAKLWSKLFIFKS